jgi:hypothetical protein
MIARTTIALPAQRSIALDQNAVREGGQAHQDAQAKIGKGGEMYPVSL